MPDLSDFCGQVDEKRRSHKRMDQHKPSLIVVNCYTANRELNSTRSFRPYIEELDQMEDYVRAHILNPKVEKVEVVKK